VSCLSLLAVRAAAAQGAPPAITRVDLSVGRSYPIQTLSPVTKISVANPDVADAVVIGERDIVVNGKALGETDVLLFTAIGTPRQYRVAVHTPADRPQVVLAVKLAEVRRDRANQVGFSHLYRGKNATTATGGQLGAGANIRPKPGEGVADSILVRTGDLFTSVLGFNDARDFFAFLEAQQRNGDARILAEPTLVAADRDSASFLAGGELPIPIAQPNAGGAATVTILFREFGVRLNFTPEVLNDSMIRLRVRPEVSSLDYSNAITLQGFTIPAFTTRRMQTTVDVRRDQALIISGLFNESRQRTRTGVPFLMNIPILGALFSSTQWQRNESELLVVVTPSLFDPAAPRPRDTIRFVPDTTLPAREAIEKRLPAAPRPARTPR
jgi:pilus assembly protein CpaC